MCLCAFHYARDESCAKLNNIKLVLIFNRDEFYTRPTAPLHQWSEEEKLLIGGQDRQPGREGGTWLVASAKTGRISALTNHLTCQPKDNMRGRGRLVVDYCLDDQSKTAKDYFDGLKLDEYNPFNLLMIDLKNHTVYVGNNHDQVYLLIN